MLPHISPTTVQHSQLERFLNIDTITLNEVSAVDKLTNHLPSIKTSVSEIHILRSVVSITHRTRSGALPSRHAHPDHTGRLSKTSHVLAECGVSQTYVQPKAHKRQESVPALAKDYWMGLQIVAHETNAPWLVSTPRVLNLGLEGPDGSNRPDPGTRPKRSPASQGILGVDTSEGVLDFVEKLLEAELKDLIDYEKSCH